MLEEYERLINKYGHVKTHKAFESYYYNIEEDCSFEPTTSDL